MQDGTGEDPSGAGGRSRFRVMFAGAHRYYVAFGVFMVLLLAPYPWADRLESVYGYYALGLLVLFLGTLVALLIRNLRRLAREVRQRE